VKHVLFYESADDITAKAPRYFSSHRARWKEFQARGDLLMIFPFAKPEEGAMAIFASGEAAEEFARGDPFVLNGVVRNWYIRA